MINRTVRRIAVVAAVSTAAVIGLAGPARAESKLALTPARPGAVNATMRVTVDAEESRSGIRSVRMVLPSGLTASQISLVKGPAGWKLRSNDDGFTVSGSTLKVKADAVFTVKIARLPAKAGVLTFKTYVTYGNGHVDKLTGAAGTANAAPSVRLAAPSPSATPSLSASATPSAASSPIAMAATSGDGDSPGTLWLVLATIAGLLTIGLVISSARARPHRLITRAAGPPDLD